MGKYSEESFLHEKPGAFIAFTLIFFKKEKLAWKHLIGFGFLVTPVFFVFKNGEYYLIGGLLTLHLQMRGF
jgi:hypothetical protein